MQVGVFISVLFLKRLKVVQLILETDNLILELDDFTFAVDELGLFVFQIKRFSVYQFVEVIDSGKLFGNIVLQGSSLGGEVGAFLALKFILIV